MLRHARLHSELWDHSVEVELGLVESRVVLKSRVGDSQPRESAFSVFQAAQGSVSVARAGAAASSPSDAADRFLEPILTRAFGG